MEDELDNSEFFNVSEANVVDESSSDSDSSYSADTNDEYNSDNDSDSDSNDDYYEDSNEDEEDGARDHFDVNNDLESEDGEEGPDDDSDYDSDDDIDEDQEEPDERYADSSNFYSSIANAFAEDGIIPDSFLSQYGEIKSAEEFKAVMEDYINSNINQRNLDLLNALNVGMAPDEVEQYANVMNFLNSITESQLMDEGEEGARLRQNIIYQDYINRGFSHEKAIREVQKSFNAGTDLEDARDAYGANYDFYKSSYDQRISSLQQQRELEEQNTQQLTQDLYDDLISGDLGYNGLQVSANTRKQAFDIAANPVYEDANTGERFTELQRYQRENPVEFLKNVSLLYTLTDGFKTIDNISNHSSEKKIRSGIRSLEKTLRSSTSSYGGEPEYIANVGDGFISDDEEGWDIDA